MILKNCRKWSFSHETKASIHLSQSGEWIGGAQSIKEKRLLYKSMFIPIERKNLILKMAERDVFLMKPKRQYHLSQSVEYVYGAQAWQEKRLLCESMFILIDRQTWIVKNGWKWSFSCETKASVHWSQ